MTAISPSGLLIEAEDFDSLGGWATAAAAFLCNEHGTTPGGLYDAHLDELIGLVDRLNGHDHDPASGAARRFVAVPG